MLFSTQIHAQVNLLAKDFETMVFFHLAKWLVVQL